MLVPVNRTKNGISTVSFSYIQINSQSTQYTCEGLGGAGRGGGCLAFFGGNAGLGDSGRGGGPDFGPRLELGLTA